MRKPGLGGGCRSVKLRPAVHPCPRVGAFTLPAVLRSARPPRFKAGWRPEDALSSTHNARVASADDAGGRDVLGACAADHCATTRH